MHAALVRHDEIMRSAIAVDGGELVKTTGDGFHAVFVDAAPAVEAAVEAQRELGCEVWDATGELRVRMGLHTGAAASRGGDYPGTTVNKAARVMGIAHGGQIVLSQATEALVPDGLDAGVGRVDLGAHRLRAPPRADEVA